MNQNQSNLCTINEKPSGMSRNIFRPEATMKKADGIKTGTAPFGKDHSNALKNHRDALPVGNIALNDQTLAERETRVPFEDWDVMFKAVKIRLRSTVGERLDSTPDPYDKAGQIRATVLDCVSALDQLHAILIHEREQNHQMERQVIDMRAALALAHKCLEDARDGERQARHLSQHDSLTSLPNRHFFREQLDYFLSQPRSMRCVIALLYIDLDGFKTINDVYGHDHGDELLRIIATRLNRALRAEDKVGRLGGDEFACLLVNLPGREQVSQLARKLFDAVSAPVRLNQFKVAVRPSIGIALCPHDEMNAELLLKNADTAMYHAKRQQSGYAFFDECR